MRARAGFRRLFRLPSLAACAILLVLAFAAFRGPLSPKSWPGVPEGVPAAHDARAEDEVVDVVDGDTIVGATYGTIRVIGIDTPEAGEPLHAEAADALSRLVARRRVELLFDRETKDRYGRTLAHLLVPNGDVRLLAGEELVRRGLASVMIIPPNTLFSERLKSAQRDAVMNTRGLWALPVPSPEPYYVVGAYKFHRPSCQFAAQIPRPRKLSDRKAILAEGKSPCRACAP